MYNDDYAARSGMRRTVKTCCEREVCQAPTVTERQTWGLSGYPLASVYAPLQSFSELYDLKTALNRGTLFSELDLPFVCGGMKGGNCRG